MKISAAAYIAKRLSLLGIEDVFGLPGDYNFNMLDAIIQNPGLNWINCTNELNASYAADGYARIRGYGAVVTTFGVGELSAINGIAGAYAENVPVMKIAGVPKTSHIKENTLLHHNFSNPDYHIFEKIFSNVTCCSVFLGEENIKEEIDKAFEAFIREKRPVYIAIPVDVCEMLIDDNTPEPLPKSDPDTLNKAAGKIVQIINSSKKPLIMVDYLAKRYRLQSEIRTLSKKFGIQTTSLIMGKGLINEDDPLFTGINSGKLSNPDFLETYKAFDLVIGAGTLFSDLNTYGFAIKPDERFRINIQKNYTVIDGETFENVFMDDIIKALLNSENLHSKTVTTENHPYIGYREREISDTRVTTDDIFPALQNFLKEDDTVVIETGIIAFASSKIRLKRNSNYLSTPMWGSIGWATPAAFGAALADRSKRTVLFTGEGSHQLTFQEMANMFKYDIKPVILLLNNSGYTIERYLSNDPNDPFNDITSWDYKKGLELFKGKFFHHAVKTSKELHKALNAAKDEQKEGLVYIEIFTDKMDIPEIMKKAVSGVKSSANS